MISYFLTLFLIDLQFTLRYFKILLFSSLQLWIYLWGLKTILLLGKVAVYASVIIVFVVVILFCFLRFDLFRIVSAYSTIEGEVQRFPFCPVLPRMYSLPITNMPP